MSTAVSASYDATLVAEARPERPDVPTARRGPAAVTVLASYVTFEVALVAWGAALNQHHAMKLGAAPLAGRFVGSWTDFASRWNTVTFLALGGGLSAAILLPRAARSLAWRPLLGLAFTTTIAWVVLLNAGDGVRGLTHGVRSGSSYLDTVREVSSPHAFLATFVANVRHGDFGVHVQGHPPGSVLALWLLRRAGIGGHAWVAALCVVAAGAAVLAVLVAVRNVVGEAPARGALPFVVLAPAAIWLGSSPDAWFAGVSAWAIAAFALATSRQGRPRDTRAVTAGLLLGASLMLSYGLAVIVLPMAAIAAARPSARVRVPAITGVTTACVLLAFRVSGFSYVAGLAAARERYWAGVANDRPLRYAAFANVGALALAVGPAVVLGLFRLRGRSAWLLVGGGLAMAGVAHLSLLSKGETERIWLPFAIWLLAAGGALGTGRSARTSVPFALALQVSVALLVQTAVRTPW